jgi:mRNA-degrading endonuclease toxin of MazEF toxin-antitoxin module
MNHGDICLVPFPFTDGTGANFAATGLRCASAIKWTKLMAIAKCRILRRLGTMHEDIMLQVSRNIIALVSC